MGWYRSPVFRGLAVAASDGIIGTAGVLQGFAGAGASSTTLLIATRAQFVLSLASIVPTATPAPLGPSSRALP